MSLRVPLSFASFFRRLALTDLEMMRTGNVARTAKWHTFLNTESFDALVSVARDIHEVVHTETKGIYRFTPGYAIRQKGAYTIIDPSGREGFPLSWHLEGTENARALFHRSSEVEMELWRRASFLGQQAYGVHQVFGTSLYPLALTTLFQTHHRDIVNTTNAMPRCVESAFYHVPECAQEYRVEGFVYPHPVSKMVFR